MAKGFDPKWSLVGALVYFEGPAGATVVADEKTNGKVNLSNGAEISRLSPHFPDGALRIADQAAPSKLGLATNSVSVFLGADVCIENQFVATSWGVGGRRVLAHSESIVVYLAPADFSLHVGVKFDGAAWIDIGHVIADPEAFIGEKHDLRIRFSSDSMSIELDGAEVASYVHGVTSFVTAAQQFRFGNAYTTGTDQVFLGYIGQFRLTVGDLRAEVGGTPIQRFEALGSLDPYREYVVAHTHFDAQDNATAVNDTCGANWVFSGGAKIQTSDSKSGISSAYSSGGDVYLDDVAFDEQKWCVEFWSKRDANNGTSYYIASIMDDAGVDHAVSIRGPYFGPLTLRVAGADVAVGSASVYAPINTWWHCAIVRDGDLLAVFANGQRTLIYDLGGDAIASNGRLVLGKSIGATPYGGNADRYDEARLTIGHSRYNVSATTIDVSTERFNEYGPHSMRGKVKRMVSGSAVISPGSLVAAFDRKTLRLVSRDVSAADGSFELPSAHGDEHFVLAFDDEMNLVGYDKILPAIFS